MASVPQGQNSIQAHWAINFFEVIWANSVGEVAWVWWLYYFNIAVNYYFEEERERSLFKLPGEETKPLFIVGDTNGFSWAN